MGSSLKVEVGDWMDGGRFEVGGLAGLILSRFMYSCLAPAVKIAASRGICSDDLPRFHKQNSETRRLNTHLLTSTRSPHPSIL